jgi:alpha-tubulin suppressor-like RCC1 family protein
MIARRLAASPLIAVVAAVAAGCDGGAGPTSVAWVWAGEATTCANTYDRHLWCWGANAAGQVGDGTTANRDAPVRPAGDPKDVSFVYSASGDTCVVQQSRLVCWGVSSGGDGGIVSQPGALVPTPQAVMPDAITNVANPPGARCVVKLDGSAWCWGNGGGFLGDGSDMGSAVPVPVITLSTGVTALLGTGTAAYALKADGTVWGWGAVGGAKLMATAQPLALTPVAIVRTDDSLLDGIRQISGQGACVCALADDRRISCWGAVVTAGTSSDAAIDIGAGGTAPPALEIAVGGNSICLIDATAAVQCAGGNANGQLGDGTTTNRFTMAPVSGLPARALHVAAGGGHYCALLDDLTLWCWGANGGGQLGLGDEVDHPRPAQVKFGPS